MFTCVFRPLRARRALVAKAVPALVAALSITATTTATSSASSGPAVASASSAVTRSLHLAATRSTQADRTLVDAATTLRRCVTAHPQHCTSDRLALQHAGVILATQERNFARIARGTATAGARRAPRLAVHGDTLSWNRLARVQSYIISRKVPGQAEDDILVSGTTATPPPVPGVTVNYSVRSAVASSAWSSVQSIAYPDANAPSSSEGAPVTDPQAAPALAVLGQTLTWSPVATVNNYVLQTNVPGHAAQYSLVSGSSTTPAAVAGATVTYSVRTAVDGSAWSPTVSIAYSTSTPNPVPSVPLPSNRIIGTNDGAGWGAEAAATIIAGHITWNRVEIGMASNTAAESQSYGFHTLAIVGNTEDNEPLAQVNPAVWGQTVVNQLQSNPGISIAEAGNEMYLKGGIANPVRYGEMYLAAVNDMRAAGIHTHLLFNMTGDIPTGTWASPTSWSQDANGGGWLRDAVNAVPGLAAAIAENGISVHPYGALTEDREDDSGVKAVATEESIAQNVLGTTPNLYITEFGYSLSACGAPSGACSQEEQASKMRAAYQAFLSDPHVAGIWAYQSHDDGTGQWGLMNNDGSTRPVFGVISSFATEQGQSPIL